MIKVTPGCSTEDLIRGKIFRRRVQFHAKRLGLPASGTTERIARLVRIAASDPQTWSRQDFEEILPHLSVHQDLRGGSNVEMLLRQGLSRGMVDPATGLEPSTRSWSWARGYLGHDAYVLVTGGLKFVGRNNPRLGPGNMPLFHARPAKSGSLWEALQERAITLPP